MILETVVVGELGVNCYILAASKRALIIDPGADDERICAILDRHGLVPGLVVNTHGHYDHIGCDDCFGVEVCIHKDDAPMLRDPKLNLSVVLGDFYKVHSKVRTLDDGQEVTLDGIRLEVIHTPGHSPGGICLLLKEPQGGILFSGDTLFCGSVGRTDLPGGDGRLLQKTMRGKLAQLPDDTIVYPGHGPSSTIGREKRLHLFLGR